VLFAVTNKKTQVLLLGTIVLAENNTRSKWTPPTPNLHLLQEQTDNELHQAYATCCVDEISGLLKSDR